MSNPNPPIPGRPPILRHFSYGHLPEHLQAFSKPLCELAEKMAAEIPPSAELSAGLRKLIEAKDCFVRAALEAKAEREKSEAPREG